MSDVKDLVDSITDFSDLDLPGAIEGEEMVLFEMPKLDPVVSNPNDRALDLEADYMKAREMNHFQQEVLRIALVKQLENAMNGDQPRQMEVLATLSTQISNNTKQLLEIQKQMKTITETKTTTTGDGQGPRIQAESVFIGNTNDLLNEVGSRQEMLREKAINGSATEIQREDD